MMNSDKIDRSLEAESWEDEETLTPIQTGAAKVHMTLRLDPALYRTLLTYKRRVGLKTTTAALEHALEKGLNSGTSQAEPVLLRNLATHAITQDIMLLTIAKHLKVSSKNNADLLSLYDSLTAQMLKSNEVDSDNDVKLHDSLQSLLKISLKALFSSLDKSEKKATA